MYEYSGSIPPDGTNYKISKHMEILEKIRTRSIQCNISVLDALKKMDRESVKMLFVFDGNIFISILTIGNIQRSIIKGVDMSTPVAEMVERDKVYARVTDSQESIIKTMKEFRAECMPIVGEDGTLKDVLFWEDLFLDSKYLEREKINIPIFPLLENKINENELNIALNSYADKNIEIIDKIDLTVDEFEDKIKTTNPDIVFVDYVQLLEMPKAPNLTEATNLAIKEIKRIAIENNVIVILLSQLSRAVENRCDKKPLLSDLRNGSLLEEISDIILFIYREEYYEPNSEIPTNLIITAKNSVGPTGIISLDFKNGFFRNQAINNSF